MKRYVCGAVLAASFVASPALASQRCVDFEILGNQGRVTYDPFNPSNVGSSFQVKVRRLDQRATSVRFLLVDTTPTADGPGLGAAGPALYDIRWNQDSTRPVFATGADFVTGNNGAQVSFSGRGAGVEVTQFQLVVPRGQEAAAGQQLEQLAVRFQCFSGSDRLGSESEQVSGDMRLELTVPRQVTAYVGGVGQTRARIDFGTISPNTSNLGRSVSVTALATVPFDVAISTDNGGKLKQNPRDEAGIGYAMIYSDVEVADGDTVRCPATPMPSGRAEDLRVTLNQADIGKLRAGGYGDVITITFEPRDGGSVSRCQVVRS